MGSHEDTKPAKRIVTYVTAGRRDFSAKGKFLWRVCSQTLSGMQPERLQASTPQGDVANQELPLGFIIFGGLHQGFPASVASIGLSRTGKQSRLLCLFRAIRVDSKQGIAIFFEGFPAGGC